MKNDRLAMQQRSELLAFDQELAQSVENTVDEMSRFIVIGGDHSCAIGTWRGATRALAAQGATGLIWIDAHMDAHTPRTSPSGNRHGMPLAALLGSDGAAASSTDENTSPVFLPQHVCLIGVRSYEPEEAHLLERSPRCLVLGVVRRTAHQHFPSRTARASGLGSTALSLVRRALVRPRVRRRA